MMRGSKSGKGKAACAAALVSVLLAFAATWPVLLRFDHWGRGDWDQHFFYQAVPRRTLLEYGQWPLWNPWYCGGMVMLANPQSRFLSPTFSLVLAAGTVAGVKLEIMVHYALCLAGGMALCRTLGLSALGSLMGAAAYGLCTMFAKGLAEGMTWLMACAYVPWALAFFVRSLATPCLTAAIGWASLCAAAWVLMFFNGGAYPLAWTALAIGVYAACETAERVVRRAGRSSAARPLCLFVLAALLTLALGGVKFVPSIAYMQAHPRRLSDRSGYGIGTLLSSLAARPEGVYASEGGAAGFWRGATWTPEENAVYIGVIPLALAALGLVASGRRHWKVWVILGLLLWASLGSLCPASLWAALRQCPVFASMRVAQRARLVGVLLVAVFAGYGVQAIARRRRWGTLLAVGLVAVSLGDLVAANVRIFRHAFVVSPAKARKRLRFVQISKLDDVDASLYVDNIEPLARRTLSMLYPAFLCNMGTIDALESAATRRRPVPSNRNGYRGEAFVVGAEGRARLRQWSPNRVVVEAELAAPGQLALNQNYDRGWRTTGAESPAKWVNGFVGCDLSSGRSVVTFAYRPRSAAWGACLSLLTLGAIAFCWVWQYRSPCGRGGHK